ncbi:MAG: hypothetical protein HUK22_04415, partial [Thermoguttaceae bacterium]|nr:hypothetical protein [Thermoguttaceae bacterium]
MFDTDATIVAQASAQGSARRGIVRLSGKNTLAAVAPFLYEQRAGEAFFPITPKPLDVESIRIVAKTVALPCWFAPWVDSPFCAVSGLFFYWPRNRGFTGEPSGELHILGSQPVLEAVVRAICSNGAARLARRGEFTLRAF